MSSKSLSSKRLKNEFKETSNDPIDCKVSRASTELMLDRFCNGRNADFPFAK